MNAAMARPSFELAGFAPWALPHALEALDAGDALGFMTLVDNQYGLQLVNMNRGALTSRGIYEAALVHALTGCRTNNHQAYPLIRRLLNYADKARLRAAGDPIPTPGPFTLYRGVAGKGAARCIRGYSWTADPERAQWFADRSGPLGLADPAVMRAIVPTRHILFCSNERSESEFFLDLPAGFPVERLSAAEGDGE